MKENSKISNKYSAARKYVHSALLLLPPGGALPGLREMVKRTGIGRTILERVLAEAEADCCLERRPRSGYYRSGVKTSTGADLAILLDNSNGQLNLVGAFPQRASYVSRIVLRLQELARLNSKRLFITDDVDSLGPDTLLFAVGPCSEMLLEKAQKRSLRTVTVSGHARGVLQVLPPKEQNVCCGLDYLYKTGHRRIGLFYNVQNNLPYKENLSSFLFEYYKFMAGHGIKSCEHFLIACTDENAVISQLTYALHHEVRPDALVVPACWLPTVYKVLAAGKLLVPWHISILGIGNPDELLELKPFPALISDIPEKVADKAWELMYSAEQNICIRLEPQIIPGNSVRHYTPEN